MHRWKGILVILVTAGLCGWTWLEDDGMVGLTKHPNRLYPTPGCICHGLPPEIPVDSVHVWISGADTVTRGSSYVFQISVAKTGNLGAGFDLAVFYGGVDTIPGQGTRLDTLFQQDITHDHPKLASGHDTISWNFTYIAPDTFGVFDTLYANGNSVNLDDTPDSGDAWNFADNKLVWVMDDATDIKNPVRPVVAILNQNHPNPFNPSTTITYELRQAGRVELVIFNSLGQKVRTLERTVRPSGLHRTTWDGRDNSGQPVGSGVYFYRLSSGLFSAVKRMIMLK